MDKPKLIICYIGQDVEDVLPLSLNSIKDVADHIVFIDGGSTDGTIDILLKDGFLSKNSTFAKNKIIINRTYEHNEKGANGRARNCYLKYIQEHFPNDWCLVLDPDEVVENPEGIREAIETAETNKADCIHPIMEHFIENLSHVDTTQQTHYCVGRMFKISKKVWYPESEHPTLTGFEKPIIVNNMFKLWHLAYCMPNMFAVRKKFLNHMEKSEIHTKKQLQEWYYMHIMGLYPKKRIEITSLPDILKKHFMIDSDYFYFESRRNIEAKHFLMTKQWVDHFKLNEKKVLFCGCGMNHYGFAINTYGVDSYGFDISEYAVKNSPYKKVFGDQIFKSSLTDDLLDNKIKMLFNENINFDLVCALDVLEHITYDQLGKALINIRNLGDKYLFSIPVLGDLNLEKDKTHVIKESKEWWFEQAKKFGIKLKEAPKDWLFNEQLFVGEKDV